MIDGARFDHAGIVVPSIAEALPFYRDTLGLLAGHAHHLPDMGVDVQFVGEGSARVELLQPLDETSGVARFLQERGRASLHHLAFAVDDLAKALRDLAAAGYELIDQQPRHGAEGSVGFLHPRAAGGVLIELIQRRY